MNSKSIGILENSEKQHPIDLIKVHLHKVVVKLDTSMSDKIKKGDHFTLSIHDNIKIPVLVSKVADHSGDLMCSLKILELDNETYMAFHEYLDSLNTKAFKNRETNYRNPAYHLTLGYYKKRKETEASVEY